MVAPETTTSTGAAASATGAAATAGTSNTHTHTQEMAYNAEELGKKLVELDTLVPQVEAPLHQDKFQKVQAFLKKNNELIAEVSARQKEAGFQQDQAAGAGGVAVGGEGNKKALQQCAEMIKELNDNLTQIYDIYAELQPTAKEEE